LTQIKLTGLFCQCSVSLTIGKYAQNKGSTGLQRYSLSNDKNVEEANLSLQRKLGGYENGWPGPFVTPFLGAFLVLVWRLTICAVTQLPSFTL
jgi:hypothetical protein